MADVIEIITSTKMQIGQIPLSQDSADRVKSYIFIACNVCVSHHLGYAADGNVLVEHQDSECMAAGVESQLITYAKHHSILGITG